MATYNSTYTGAQHDAYVTKSALVDLIYPVGAIYMSTNSTSPQTLFGGTWEQIQGMFLLAASSTYAAGTTGGESTHTLTVNEMPTHTHTHRCWIYNGANASGGAPRYGFSYAATGDLGTGSTSGEVQHYNVETGGGVAHNNMPPYLAVYVWKRKT